MSGDGRFILKGDLFDMQNRQNVSENERELARAAIFANLSSEEYIEFSPEKPEHIIYVFTDIDCGYCRKLHHDVPLLNKNGLAVRYLAYPRGGIGSSAHSKLEAVWCADDRQQAMTDAKNGKDVESRQCSNPVANEYELGQKFGIRGTPAIYKANGEELSGYVPPDSLLEIVKN
jgi:thiol:disulfide interchange protein DsbC